MTNEWYYFKGEQRLGPLSPKQLKSIASDGKLLPTDLVWKEGMSKAVRAEKIKGLFESTRVFPEAQTPEQPIETASSDSRSPAVISSEAVSEPLDRAIVSDTKFNWRQWTFSSKLIFVSACIALLSMPMKWDVVGTKVSNGLVTKAFLALGLFVYPVLIVLRNGSMSFKYGVGCAIAGILYALVSIGGRGPQAGSMFFLLASLGLLAGAAGRSSSPTKEKYLAVWNPMSRKERFFWGGGAIGGLLAILFLFVVIGENNAVEARQIHEVKNIRLKGIPKYPIGEVLDSVCKSPKWSCIKTKDGVPVVEFTGGSKQGKVLFQFQFQESGPMQTYSEIDGRKLSLFEQAGFYLAAFKKYDSKTD